MATFIRNHPGVAASAAGTTVALALAANVPTGNLLIATVVNGIDSGAAVSSLSKPGGESASWIQVSSISITNAAGTARSRLSLWVIRPTITWSSGQTITATLNATSGTRTIALSEWEGVSVTVLASNADGINDNPGHPTVSADTGSVMRAGDLAVQAVIVQFGSLLPESSGGTAAGTRQDFNVPYAGSATHASVAAYQITTGGNRTVSYTDDSRAKAVAIVGLQAVDYPPNTPVLVTNASGGIVDRGRVIRLGWTFSSPNAVDSQSAYTLRYRAVGNPTWSTVTGTTALFREFTAGFFAAGDWEWQLQYNGALGKASGWSTSGFFTGADQPDGPTFIYPISGQMLDQFETVTWSTPDGQDAYQFRRLADDGGDPDPGTIYQDTNEVVDSTTRALTVNFSVNNRAEHIQIRVKVDGLWSEWDDVLVDVSYTPPPTPSRTLYADIGTATVLVVIDNPAPTGDDPAAVYNDIYVDDGKGEQRRATGVSTNGSWRYMTPVSGRDYELSIRVVAVAANGTTASD